MLDLEAMLDESDNRVPLICLLSTGSDPTPQIEAMAKSRMQELHQLSLGQGQEEAARKLMQVITQNDIAKLSFFSKENRLASSFKRIGQIMETQLTQ